MDERLNQTMKFEMPKEKESTIAEILNSVYIALDKKGYDPKNQIIGYILSGDPTYITSHDNARSKIRQIERDDLLEEILNYYLVNKIGK